MTDPKPPRVRVAPDGTTTVLPDPPKGGYKLAFLQKEVGGYIEITYPKDEASGQILVVDEEGRLKGLPVNVWASKVAGQVIVGPVLFLQDGDVQ